jgi:hypothetical protein
MQRRQYLALVAAGTLAGCGESSDTDGDGGDGGGDGGGDDSDDTPTATQTGADTTTPTPTETSTEPPTPTSPDPMSFSGSGQKAVEDVDMIGGVTIVDASHDGESNFQVEFVPSEGDFNELFVNEIGQWEGSVANLIDADTYIIDVTADGDWELTVRQPRPTSGDALSQSASGEGAEVVGPYEFDGTHIATGSHDGESNFQVEVLPIEGSFAELVFNEIGEFEGETTFSHDGLGYVDVNADGAWDLELE